MALYRWSIPPGFCLLSFDNIPKDVVSNVQYFLGEGRGGEGRGGEGRGGERGGRGGEGSGMYVQQ